MNRIISLISISILLLQINFNQAHAGTISSGGDCLPVEWKLPQKGKNCDVALKFGNPLEYAVWTCENDTFLMEFDLTPSNPESEFKNCLKVKRVISTTIDQHP